MTIRFLNRAGSVRTVSHKQGPGFESLGGHTLTWVERPPPKKGGAGSLKAS